jgi:hypothetical protein
MRNILYVIAVVLLVSWIIGAFFSTVGNAIHLLLLLGLASLVFGYFRRDRDVV